MLDSKIFIIPIVKLFKTNYSFCSIIFLSFRKMLVREKENPVAGYMGFIPSKEEKDLSQGHHFDFHIPGYVGYIPSIKA